MLAQGLKQFFHYETVQIVRIRNVRVALIYHLAQLAILGYIIGYGLIYKKAYQATGQVVGSSDIKVKGVGYVNQTLPWAGPSNSTCPGDSCFHVYDSYDLILPPMEENALFVTTNMWVTRNQNRGICQSYGADNKCDPTDPNSCQPLKYVVNGRQTGLNASCRTNYTDPQQVWPSVLPSGSFCDVYAWCPTEFEITNKSIVNNFGIQGVNQFTVFVRMNVNFPKFGYTLDNSGNSNLTTNFLNLWTIDQMVQASGWSYNQIQNQGMTLAMNAVWDCNFDQSLDYCQPAIQFVRLDDPTSKLSPGFNFRSVEPVGKARQLTKHYGVRLLVLISGTGAKFDWAALFTAIGAGIGLLSVATLIADFVATNLLQNRNIYRDAKFSEVDVPDEVNENEEGIPASSSQTDSAGYQPPSDSSSKLGHPTADADDGDEEDPRVESWGVARYPTKD